MNAILGLATWVLIAAIALLAGCASPAPQVVEVAVPVPVACQVAEPARPALGIDSVPATAPLDVLVRHLRADHDVRDGYEGELRAALQACRTLKAEP